MLDTCEHDNYSFWLLTAEGLSLCFRPHCVVYIIMLMRVVTVYWWYGGIFVGDTIQLAQENRREIEAMQRRALEESVSCLLVTYLLLIGVPYQFLSEQSPQTKHCLWGQPCLYALLYSSKLGFVLSLELLMRAAASMRVLPIFVFSWYHNHHIQTALADCLVWCSMLDSVESWINEPCYVMTAGAALRWLAFYTQMRTMQARTICRLDRIVCISAHNTMIIVGSLSEFDCWKLVSISLKS